LVEYFFTALLHRNFCIYAVIFILNIVLKHLWFDFIGSFCGGSTICVAFTKKCFVHGFIPLGQAISNCAMRSAIGLHAEC